MNNYGFRFQFRGKWSARDKYARAWDALIMRVRIANELPVILTSPHKHRTAEVMFAAEVRHSFEQNHDILLTARLREGEVPDYVRRITLTVGDIVLTRRLRFDMLARDCEVVIRLLRTD